ncbi:MAG TPA: flagellar export chaperone FlgN [Longimicrobiaceae bacterium]|nr:flagellar export chaperone FlgN [Longimicrobiaceae bacterium]
MAPTQAGNGHLRAVGGASPAAVEALTNAVTSEVRLLEDLIGIMRRQRKAVSVDDLQGVDDSVFATHRVLVTLAEARRRRRSINELLGASDDMPLRDVDALLGDQMTPELRFARDGLQAAALTLSQEVEMNRQVLREAIAAGSNYVRTLYGGLETRASYSADRQQPELEPAGGLLLNRRA